METAAKKYKQRKRTNITAYTIVGDDEFYEAFGLGEKLAAKMRAHGMPCNSSERGFVYIPEDVVAWIRENWKVTLPQITELKRENKKHPKTAKQ